MNNLDSDQTAFLAELQQYASRRQQKLRRLRLGGIGVAAAAALMVVGLIAYIPALSSPAYAVTDAPQGGTRITLNSLHDADGLAAELAKRGITATVTFGGTDTGIRGVEAYTPEEVAAGKAGDVLAHAPSDEPDVLSGTPSPKSCPDLHSKSMIGVEVIDGKTVIDVPDGALTAGEKLMITTSGDDRSQAALDVSWTTPEGVCRAGSIFIDADLSAQSRD
ncbi:hypothetical protein G7068_09150 [Leucobacter viscericola]|uniref:Uncharacterized protein n=1 Tax=Leucobacter viscericola TaxID=2714935 RepID=A0A6G7XG45_9MICO|nr:hypothetical protein [Leucobacter viscericola]QIK63348.1 hypothetical protein G7068_09150 [Leucobacter viscericola]